MANRAGRAGDARPWLATVLLAGALVLGVGLMVVLLESARGKRQPDAWTTELAHLKMLGTALKLHAEEHGGKFPVTISGIDWRQNLPGMKWEGLPAAVSRFHDPDSGALMEWIYYPGHTTADPPDSILAAAPAPVGEHKDRRLVVRLNGVAEVMTEGAFRIENKQAAVKR